MVERRREPSQALKTLTERIDAWRTAQGRRSMIPDELWDAAVEVAKGSDGVWLTQQLTRFHYGKLKTKVAEASHRGRKALVVHERVAPVTANRVVTKPKTAVVRGKSEKPSGAAGFIELPMTTLTDGGRTVIEFVGRHGDRMRVEATGGVDLVGLARTFWRGGES